MKKSETLSEPVVEIVKKRDRVYSDPDEYFDYRGGHVKYFTVKIGDTTPQKIPVTSRVQYRVLDKEQFQKNIAAILNLFAMMSAGRGVTLMPKLSIGYYEPTHPNKGDDRQLRENLKLLNEAGRNIRKILEDSSDSRYKSQILKTIDVNLKSKVNFNDFVPYKGHNELILGEVPAVEELLGDHKGYAVFVGGEDVYDIARKPKKEKGFTETPERKKMIKAIWRTFNKDDRSKLSDPKGTSVMLGNRLSRKMYPSESGGFVSVNLSRMSDDELTKLHNLIFPKKEAPKKEEMKKPETLKGTIVWESQPKTKYDEYTGSNLGEERFVITDMGKKPNQDQYMMYVISQERDETKIKPTGTHPSLSGAKKYAKARGFEAQRALSKRESQGLMSKLGTTHGDGTKAHWEAVLDEVRKGVIAPSAVVGSGYKDAKKSAIKWLQEKIKEVAEPEGRIVPKKFIHKTTGEIRTQIPIMSIGEWEEYDPVKHADPMDEKPVSEEEEQKITVETLADVLKRIETLPLSEQLSELTKHLENVIIPKRMETQKKAWSGESSDRLEASFWVEKERRAEAIIKETEKKIKEMEKREGEIDIFAAYPNSFFKSSSTLEGNQKMLSDHLLEAIKKSLETKNHYGDTVLDMLEKQHQGDSLFKGLKVRSRSRESAIRVWIGTWDKARKRNKEYAAKIQVIFGGSEMDTTGFTVQMAGEAHQEFRLLLLLDDGGVASQVENWELKGSTWKKIPQDYFPVSHSDAVTMEKLIALKVTELDWKEVLTTALGVEWEKPEEGSPDKKLTYKQAQNKFLDFLEKIGKTNGAAWVVSDRGLATPYADKRKIRKDRPVAGELIFRLWFKPQSVYMGGTTKMGDASSLHLPDLRTLTNEQFYNAVVNASKKRFPELGEPSHAGEKYTYGLALRPMYSGMWDSQGFKSVLHYSPTPVPHAPQQTRHGVVVTPKPLSEEFLSHQTIYEYLPLEQAIEKAMSRFTTSPKEYAAFDAIQRQWADHLRSDYLNPSLFTENITKRIRKRIKNQERNNSVVRYLYTDVDPSRFIHKVAHRYASKVFAILKAQPKTEERRAWLSDDELNKYKHQMRMIMTQIIFNYGYQPYETMYSHKAVTVDGWSLGVNIDKARYHQSGEVPKFELEAGFSNARSGMNRTRITLTARDQSNNRSRSTGSRSLYDLGVVIKNDVPEGLMDVKKVEKILKNLLASVYIKPYETEKSGVSGVSTMGKSEEIQKLKQKFAKKLKFLELVNSQWNWYNSQVQGLWFAIYPSSTPEGKVIRDRNHPAHESSTEGLAQALKSAVNSIFAPIMAPYHKELQRLQEMADTPSAPPPWATAVTNEKIFSVLDANVKWVLAYSEWQKITTISRRGDGITIEFPNPQNSPIEIKLSVTSMGNIEVNWIGHHTATSPPMKSTDVRTIEHMVLLSLAKFLFAQQKAIREAEYKKEPTVIVRPSLTPPPVEVLTVIDADETELVPTGEMPEDTILVPMEEEVPPVVEVVVKDIPSMVINKKELIGKALGFFTDQGYPLPPDVFAKSIKSDSTYYELRLK